MNQKFVVFYANDARILTNPSPEMLAEHPHVAVDTAAFVNVEHVPSHFWKLENGKIVEMNEHEKRQRMDKINMHIFAAHSEILKAQYNAAMQRDYATHILSVDDLNDRLKEFCEQHLAFADVVDGCFDEANKRIDGVEHEIGSIDCRLSNNVTALHIRSDNIEWSLVKHKQHAKKHLKLDAFMFVAQWVWLAALTYLTLRK